MVKITNKYEGNLNVNNWWEFSLGETAVVEDAVWDKQRNHPIVQAWVNAGVLVVVTMTKTEVEEYKLNKVKTDLTAEATEIEVEIKKKK